MDEWVKKMYKSSNGFGDNNQKNRRETANERRKTNRETALNKRRNIPLNMSPMTPRPTETVEEEAPKKVNNRLEMLKKWKQEKERKKVEQKKQQKPTFKWSKVEHKDNIDTALNYIKGKKITKEKSRSESIRTLDRLAPSSSNTASSTTKKTLTNYATKPNRREDNPIAGTSGALKRSQQTSTVKNASGSVRVTRNTDQSTQETKTSARYLKFTDNTKRTVVPDKISKGSGVSAIAKKVNTPKKSKKSENAANQSGSKNVASRKIGQHGFSEELLENYTKNDNLGVAKSPRNKGTRKTLENPKILPENPHQPEENAMNTTFSPARRSSRISNNFSEELLENYTKNDSLGVAKSPKNKGTRKTLENPKIIAESLHQPEENAINTTFSPARRSSRISNCFSEELLENSEENDSFTLLKSTKMVKTRRKSPNNSKISTPTTEGSVKIKTPRSSASKRISRTSRSHNGVNNEEAEAPELEENTRVSRSILNTPKTDWKLIENETYGTSSKKPKSPRKSLANKPRRNYVTPNKSDQMDQSESDIPTITLNDSEISTPNLNRSKIPKMKTPNSSPSKKSTRNSRLDEAGLENRKSPRKSVINTPKTDWKLVEHESFGTRSLRKSLGIKSVKNYVTPIKSMENLAISSVPRNVRSPRNSALSTPIPKTKTPSSVTRRKSRIHNAEERETPKLEEDIEDGSARKPKSLRKSILHRKNSGFSPLISTKRRSLGNVQQMVEVENISPTKKTRSPRKSLPKSEGSDYFTPVKSPLGSDEVFVTPEKVPDEPIVYVSPFVTTTRGKSQARQEFKMRKSVEAANASFSNHDSAKSPRAAAAYFTRILNAEIEKLQEKCNTWDEYKNSGVLSEDACGLIDMAIGQTNLLISKKFNQFRGLIEKCRTNNESEMRIQCEDLHGFWDMIYKQVNDLNKRFANLQEMKDNNWLEEAPKKKTPKKIAKKKRNKNKSAPAASSVLKETILAARRKMAKNTNPDVEICILEEPSKNPQLDCSTPGRGILKSQNTKSEKRKTVVFKEVKLRTPKSANRNTPNQPIRRSLRLTLSGTKLNFE